ncbi:MAG: membrane dipeptidase [Parasphingorhabdus sp.]|uniref:dipeptidase n=1 Tax=Parasphingorhabdus sp. TaxID=2709688 RepID=UPI00329936E4
MQQIPVKLSGSVQPVLRGMMTFAVATLLSACATAQTETAATPDVPKTEAALVERARNIHQQSLVLDAHADIALPSTSKTYLGADGLSKVDPAKLRAGGVDAVIMSVAVGPGPRTTEGRLLARAEANEKLAAVSNMVQQDQDLGLAKSTSDIEKLNAEGKTAIILGFQNARSLNGNVGALDQFYAAGVRVFGLNHLGHNDFSDSSRPLYIAESRSYETTEEHGGLSPLGRAAIERINALGGVVDVSQMSKAATLQAIKLSRSPVIASHSNVRELSNVSRNLSDEEIDLIAETGGVIHLAAFGAYLVDLSDPELLASILKVRRDAGLPDAYSYPYELYWEIADPKKRQSFLVAMRDVIGTGSVDRLVDHIDYIVNRVGIDHVGIGSDFNHGGGVAGFVDASEALNVTTLLVKRGYSSEKIKKIWSENFLRVFRATQNMADKVN